MGVKNYGFSFIIMVEMIRFMEGIKEVKKLGIVNVITEGDNKYVIEVFKSKYNMLWEIYNILLYVNKNI